MHLKQRDEIQLRLLDHLPSPNIVVTIIVVVVVVAVMLE
jgi:hypothetical protein